jgi:hypothetical protein
MSEITWAAIIGASGALIGSGIAGLISYFISRLQTDARNNELERQLKHQEGESRRSRLIETRSRYLIPLREIVSKWVIELHHFINEVEKLGVEIGNQKQYSYSSREDGKLRGQALLNEIRSKMEALRGELEIALGQVTDKKLSDVINELLFKEISVRLDSWPILSHEMNLWMKRGTSIASINKALDNIRVASWQLQDHLQQVNKRIEELLIGDEAE